MTWMLFSLSKILFSACARPPHPSLSPGGEREGGGFALRATLYQALLADPFHVAVDGDLADLDDLAALDLDEPRAIGRPMVLVGIGERRGAGWSSRSNC